MTVVVGYVPTDVGRAALRRAAHEAELRGWKLITVYTDTIDSQFDQDEQDALAAERKVITDHLDTIGIEHEMRRFTGKPAVRGTDPSLPERGIDPGEDIVAVARESGARLVVLGLRRRSLVGKLLMGSNAQKIMQNAPCAVLGVHVDDVTE
ncbi:universal stress protein [Georgenia sp. Z1344]|uniref:universal stress protein n=1 Tax=Georgenia sp. Z1344 TaxID=3416706 RepID=UPI003CFA1B07